MTLHTLWHLTLCTLNWNGQIPLFVAGFMSICYDHYFESSSQQRPFCFCASKKKRSNLPNRASQPSSGIGLKGPEVLGYFKYFTVPALQGPDDEGNMFLRKDGTYLPVDIWIFTSNPIHPNRSLQWGQHACAVKIGVYISKLRIKILVFKLWHCVDWQLSEQLASPSSRESLTTYTPDDTLTYPIKL